MNTATLLVFFSKKFTKPLIIVFCLLTFGFSEIAMACLENK